MTTAEATAPPAPARAWLVLTVLTFVYVINFLDRQLLTFLAKPIKDALQISDSEFGLLTGFYFACFYCFIAIPIGWLADRTNRVTVLSLACAIWSGATAACGMAANYSQLTAARMVVGFGEAGGVPPSYAIITDTFPPGKRASALGIYNFGPPAGAALGVAFGGWIAIHYGWREAFITIGAIGVVTAILVRIIVRDPPRGGLDKNAEGGAAVIEKAPFWPTTWMFLTNPVLLLSALGGGATQFVTYGLGNFAVIFLMENKGMTLQEVSVWYALALLVGMGGSMIISGRVLDWITRHSRTGYALAPALSLAVALPFYIAFVWAPGWQLALGLLTIVMLFNYVYLSATVALVQDEVKPGERVLCGALLLLGMNFIGLGLGPTYVGFASDALKALHFEAPRQLALYSIAPFYLIAIFLFLWLARVLRAERKAAA
ncbi:MFS transporter [Sphingomonas sp. LB-2]|uniref:spinster family MFS transporter n=1 Tax=Sphingomonas caeni TaxID=2984949 RepID=UPI00222E31A3|nr:MFS transporter [Sphingomonas caeni]MCW3848019.1 MFS transporter [Sphingomonas caeni]